MTAFAVACRAALSEGQAVPAADRHGANAHPHDAGGDACTPNSDTGAAGKRAGNLNGLSRVYGCGNPFVHAGLHAEALGEPPNRAASPSHGLQ